MKSTTGEESIALIRSIIADGIEARKAELRTCNKQIGKNFGISERTVANIIRGENVKIPFNTTLQILLFSGVRIVRRKTNE